MRKKNNEIKEYINNKILSNPLNWEYRKGANFGISLQTEIGNYYQSNAQKFNIKKVKINTNPNDENPDIVITHTNGSTEGYEIKSCKDGALNGVSICNAPHLLNNKKTFLINYTISESNVLHVVDVYETELFRLTSIYSTGKYSGCLISTRDTGKKIKGRNFNNFINTSDEDDYTLEQLTNSDLIRKTILTYSASKLVDEEYNFTDEEILTVVHNLRRNS